MKLRRMIAIGCVVTLSTSVLGCSGGARDGSPMFTQESDDATSGFDGGVAARRDVFHKKRSDFDFPTPAPITSRGLT